MLKRTIQTCVILLVSHTIFCQNLRTEAVKKEIKIVNITTRTLPNYYFKYIHVAFQYLEDGVPQVNALSLGDLYMEALNLSASPAQESGNAPLLLETNSSSNGAYIFTYSIGLMGTDLNGLPYMLKDTALHHVKIALRHDLSVFDTKKWVADTIREEYMRRDNYTSQGNNDALAPNSEAYLCFDVYDNSEQLPVSADLLVKPLSNTLGSFTSIAMEPSTASKGFMQKWCGTVPSALVAEPGFAFYATANYPDGHQLKVPLLGDGTTEWQQSVSKSDPPLTKIGLAISDKEEVCNKLEIPVSVSRAPFRKLTLYYKELAASFYNSVDLYTYSGNGPLPKDTTFDVPIMPTGIGIVSYAVTVDSLGLKHVYDDPSWPFNDDNIEQSPENDEVSNRTNRMTIYFNNTTRVDCKALKVGDVISAYYINNCGTLSLAGKKLVIDPAPTKQTLYAYGNSSTTNKNGYNTGDSLLISITQDGIEHWLIYSDSTTSYPTFAVGSILVWPNTNVHPAIALTPRYNGVMIPFADQTPSVKEGTQFESGQSVQRSYTMNAMGCGSVTYKGIESSNPDFEATIDIATGNFSINYVGNKASQATITIKTSAFDYYFNVEASIITDIEKETLAIENCTSTLFPNPASDILTLSTCQKRGTIRLMNTIGQTLLKQEIVGSGDQKISVGELEPGVYLLSIESKENNKREALKVAIQ